MILKLSVNNQSVESSGITKDYKDALCEYVWNSFEANATAVAIDCIPNELTGSAEIVITDNGDAIQENLVVELKAPKVVLTKAVLRQIEDYMDYVRKQPLFNSQYRRWKFIAVCSAVDDDVKARYDSQKSKGKKGLVAEIDNYEVYALTWDDVFQSFDLRHAFLLDKLKMDKEAIAAEIAQTAGDEKSKDTADALTALVAN